MKTKTVRQRSGLIAVCVCALMLGSCNLPGRAAVTPTPTPIPTATPAPVGSAAPAAPGTAQDILNEALNAPHDTVKSSDGRAELLIPKGALPSGVTAAQITMSAVPVSQLKLPAGMNPPKLAFQLEPNGLQFSTPALFHISFPTGARPDVPLLLLKSGDNVAPVDHASVEIDQRSGQTTLVAPIPHFSNVLVYGSGVIAKMADPKAQTVGKPFEADASFSGYALAHLTLDSSLNSRYWSGPTGATIVSERTEHTENLFTFIVDAVCEEAADDIYLEFYDVLAMSYEDVLFEVRLTLISNLFNCLAPLPPGILPPAPQPKRVPSGEEH